LQILNTIPDDEKMLGRSRPRTALRAFPVDHANNPLTDTLRALNMRLGEGTGAALSFTLIDAALKIVREMATYDQAGVSDTGLR
jgi:NaMN:DMB phosphoribosyltransferase